LNRKPPLPSGNEKVEPQLISIALSTVIPYTPITTVGPGFPISGSGFEKRHHVMSANHLAVSPDGLELREQKDV